MAGEVYKPTYENSWALVVGINRYKNASPLDFACNDACGFAETLKREFDFPDENVSVLTDDEATRAGILKAFAEFANGEIKDDDRLVFFFAGHGHTQTGRRGEIGFLVPTDGDINDISSLVRWDELTRNAELIPAKHVLFIMDACYGGLALTRKLQPGSLRFAKDMLQRYSRQVLTAGKADETVTDAGGPRAGHSVFTGHLLDALEGAAAPQDGIISANRIMAYVYERVATDYQSDQTPHYGMLDGDGDMIFSLEPIDELAEKGASVEAGTDKDVLIGIPETSATREEADDMPQTLEDRVKELLAEPKHAIKLHDLVAAEVRSVLAKIGDDSFPLQVRENPTEEFDKRLKRYEDIVRDLVTVVVLLARWGGPEQRKILGNVFARLPDPHAEHSGLTSWLGMRWYPVMLLMYAGGIAAISSDKFENLATIFFTEVGSRHGGQSQPIIEPTVEGILEVDRADLFKSLPGYERMHVPRSEYLFKTIQPPLEDLLFLGASYEGYFDRFEIFYALVTADRQYDSNGIVWGPPGRFGWKFRRNGGPFIELLAEAEAQAEKWLPLRAGFFSGSISRFREIAKAYREMLEKLHWF